MKMMEISTHSAEASRFGRLLTSAPGDEQRRAFKDWLNLNLELQLADLEEFFCSLPYDLRAHLEHQLRTGGYSDLVPAGAPLPDRLLFQMDLEVLMALRPLC